MWIICPIGAICIQVFSYPLLFVLVVRRRPDGVDWTCSWICSIVAAPLCPKVDNVPTGIPFAPAAVRLRPETDVTLLPLKYPLDPFKLRLDCDESSPPTRTCWMSVVAAPLPVTGWLEETDELRLRESSNDDWGEEWVLLPLWVWCCCCGGWLNTTSGGVASVCPLRSGSSAKENDHIFSKHPLFSFQWKISFSPNTSNTLISLLHTFIPSQASCYSAVVKTFPHNHTHTHTTHIAGNFPTK